MATGIDSTVSELEGFALGTPALVCRWRIAGGGLPLENRHLRALSARTVSGERLPTELVGWAKQHIEWTLRDGCSLHPDGVLMLIVDEEGKAAMTVGDYEPLSHISARELAERARHSSDEAADTGVAPETLWLSRGDHLVAGIDAGTRSAGATDLITQLAETLGIPVVREDGLASSVLDGVTVPYEECFLVSDEHGVVCCPSSTGPRSRRLAESYRKLLDHTREVSRRR